MICSPSRASSLSFVSVPKCFLSSPARTGLTPSIRQALRVFVPGGVRDFGSIAASDDVEYEDAALALAEQKAGNDLPLLAILGVFQGIVLRRVSHLWTLGAERDRIVFEGMRAVHQACRRVPDTPKLPFPMHVLSRVRFFLSFKHKSSMCRLYLSLSNENLRDRVHEAVMAYKAKSVILNREVMVAQDLDIPYLRVVQMLSLWGPANPYGAFHASDISPEVLESANEETIGGWLEGLSERDAG